MKDVREPFLLSGLRGMAAPLSQKAVTNCLGHGALPDEEAHADANGEGNQSRKEGKKNKREMRQNNYPTSCFGNGHYPTLVIFAQFVQRLRGQAGLHGARGQRQQPQSRRVTSLSPVQAHIVTICLSPLSHML